MESKTTDMTKDFLISFFLPDGMTDRFDVVRVTEECNTGTARADILYSSVLNITSTSVTTVRAGKWT